MKIIQNNKDIRSKFNKTRTLFKYSKERNSFVILDDAKEELTEINVAIKLDDEYSYEKYEVVSLHSARENWSESSICQVKVEGIRIGWIIPVQALNSKEHDYADNIHFLKYAYIGWCYLLKNVDIEGEDFDKFDLFSFYGDDAALLVLDKENCNQISEFRLDNYIVSLFENGYSLLGECRISIGNRKRDKNVNLKRQSQELDNIPYITELFKKQIPQEESAVSRFYIYYQIIEILIARVFDDTFKEFIKDINNDSSDLYNKKEELSEMANEKRRVIKLLVDYGQIDSLTKHSLDKECEELLNYTNSKVGSSMPEKIYQVRCLLVHRMYLLDDSAQEILRRIDDLFLECLIKLILSFQNPTSDVGVGNS